jgi:hypothetical protein
MKDIGLTQIRSCEDSNTTQPPVSRWEKAPLAAIRGRVVRRMYDVDNRKFTESWDTYVLNLVAEEQSLNSMLTMNIGFVAFDQYKALLQDADGKISGPRTVIAGFGAGVTESLLAVTPFESIKTTL